MSKETVRCVQCSSGFGGKPGKRWSCTGGCGVFIHSTCLGDYGSGGDPGKDTWRCKNCVTDSAANSPQSTMEEGAITATQGEVLILQELRELHGQIAEMKELLLRAMPAVVILPNLQVNAQPLPGEKGGNNSRSYVEVAASPSRQGAAITPAASVGGETPVTSKTLSQGKANAGNSAPAAKTVPAKPAAPAATQKKDSVTRLTNDIFVTKKKAQNNNKQNATALEAVKKNLGPKIIKDHIENVVALQRSSSVVVKCTNEESSLVVAAALQKAIGDDYQVEESRQKTIKVAMMVKGVYDEDLVKEPNGDVDRAYILNAIKEKNDIPPDCFLQVLQARKSNKKGSLAHLMLLVDETAKTQLEEKGVKIGYKRLTVEDLGPIPICYKCGGYNHSTSRCFRTEATCYICAETGHTGRDCAIKRDQAKHKCVNCKNYNKKVADDPNIEHINENHKAGDKINCESYKRVLKNFNLKHKKE
jgi:hypothetical protein